MSGHPSGGLPDCEIRQAAPFILPSPISKPPIKLQNPDLRSLGGANHFAPHAPGQGRKHLPPNLHEDAVELPKCRDARLAQCGSQIRLKRQKNDVPIRLGLFIHSKPDEMAHSPLIDSIGRLSEIHPRFHFTRLAVIPRIIGDKAESILAAASLYSYDAVKQTGFIVSLIGSRWR